MTPATASCTLTWDAAISPALKDAFGSFILSHPEDTPLCFGLPAGTPYTMHVGADGGFETFRVTAAPGLHVHVPASLAEYHVRWSQLARWLNGALLTPALAALVARDVFSLFADATPRLTVMDIARARATTEAQRVAGNLFGALQMLDYIDWLRGHGRDEERAYEITSAGAAVLSALANTPAARDGLTAAAAALRHAPTWHLAMRGEGDDLQASVASYADLVARCRRGWDLPEGVNATERHALGQLRWALDGFVMCPTMVALTMPPAELQGERLVETAPALVASFRDHRLDPADLSGTVEPRFFAAARSLCEHLELWTVAKDGSATLTPRGRGMAGLMGGAGMPTSYYRMLGKLETMIFDDPTPWALDQDQHVDRVMNIFGSSAAASMPITREICPLLVRPLFDAPDLGAQPAGVADMGCGDARAVALIGDYIARETLRGKHLEEHPLAIIGGDFFESSRSRARATLASLGERPGVRVAVVEGDVTHPERYAEAIAASGVDATQLLHTLMFMTHDRQLQVGSREQAQAIFARALEHADRAVVERALRALEGEQARLPDEPAAAASYLAERFTVAGCRRGELVPASVVAADLVEFVARWRTLVRRGWIVLETHVPRPEDLRESAAADESRWLRMDMLPSIMNWGMHVLSNQYLMPFREYQLALALAGLTPPSGRVPGGLFTWGAPAFKILSYALYV